MERVGVVASGVVGVNGWYVLRCRPCAVLSQTCCGASGLSLRAPWRHRERGNVRLVSERVGEGGGVGEGG